jgi:hypothetical protein
MENIRNTFACDRNASLEEGVRSEASVVKIFEGNSTLASFWRFRPEIIGRRSIIHMVGIVVAKCSVLNDFSKV